MRRLLAAALLSLIGFGAHAQTVTTTGAAAASTFAKISTLTAATSATLDFTGIPATYNTLLLDCNGILPSANSILELQYGVGATPTWNSGTTYTNQGNYTVGGTTTAVNATNLAYVGIGKGNVNILGATVAQTTSTKVWIHNVGSAAMDKIAIVAAQGWDATSVMFTYTGGGTWTADQAVVTALRIVPASGTLTSGQCTLYGLTP